MKINEFETNRANTNAKQVAYFTDPPLTDEVFKVFEKKVRADSDIAIKVSLEGELLVVRPLDLDRQQLDRLADLLTESEKQIQRTTDAANQEHEALLKQIATQTGRSRRTKPPVA